jgi:DNA-3-methyladenine glycosylase
MVQRAAPETTKRLGVEFFRRDAATVARELIGCVLVRTLADGRRLRARIVETEAYVGTHDLACHASKGRTERTEVMFGPAGRAYVYFIYGMHEMFNVVTGPGPEAPGQAILVRAAEPLEGRGGWESKPSLLPGNGGLPNLSGPARLARAMEITRALNGIEVTGDALYFEPRAGGAGGAGPRIETSPRVGVEYAGAWAKELLRFYDADSRAVSKPPAPRKAARLKKRPPRRITGA